MFSKRARVARAYRDTFETDAGRIVLKDLIRTAGIFSPSGVLPDAELRQREGAANMVRRVLRMASLSESEIEAMVTRERVDE
jgi:hypothetical protein